LGYLFIQYNGYVYQGFIWQLFTSLFIAPPFIYGFEDVLFNSLSIILLDRFLLFSYTPGQYYFTFFITGIIGNLFSLLNGPNYASFGASGGIFGLLAGGVALDYANSRRINLPLIIWFASVLLYSSFALPNIDWLAHFGGSASGFILGYIIGMERRKEAIYRY
ncbi:MAG: rhomboid family intramembrane serine protease, partial [Conexivisphaerales archaeon]